MRQTPSIGVIGLVLAALVAAGCSGGQSDLQKWIEATKKKPGGRIQPLPEVKPYETYVYAAANLRSPFQPQGPNSANGQHLRPSSVRRIGETDQANHQYDTDDFFSAVQAGNMPAVSFLKAPGFQDAHAGYSDPLDEQTFVVQVINFLQTRPEWKSTAVVIAYDDSDGWYDHQMSPIVNQSQTAMDALNAPGQCGSSANTALAGTSGEHAQGRCGYGPRLPLLVISPYAKQNYVDHTITDQSSITRFIEDNWLGSQRITGSFDAIAGTLNGMFDFNGKKRDRPNDGLYLLDPDTGLVAVDQNN